MHDLRGGERHAMHDLRIRMEKMQNVGTALPYVGMAVRRTMGTMARQCLTYVMVLLFVTGCAFIPNKEEKTTFQTMEPQPERYAYGHGFGATRAEALQAARDELAEMILVNVRTETRQALQQQ